MQMEGRFEVLMELVWRGANLQSSFADAHEFPPVS